MNQDKARAHGGSSQFIAPAARTVNNGTNIGQYRDAEKLIDIVLRQPLAERNAITDLANAHVPTTAGRSISMGQLAQANFVCEPGVLWRDGPHRAASVQGGIVDGVQCATGMAQLDPQFAPVRAHAARLPRRGGRRGRGKLQGQGSIAAGLPIALFIMFALLMLRRHSVSRSMLAFITSVWGLAGVAGALLPPNRPFGFLALLGVIALLGMIIRNPGTLIDQIAQDCAQGVPTWTAKRRGGGAALLVNHPDGGGCRAGDVPAVAQRVLGADGGGHRGRVDRGHRTDLARIAGNGCGGVPG